MTGLCLAAAALVLCVHTQADPFPNRDGESGWLDVPSAEVRGQASGTIGAEVRYERSYGQRYKFGPSPVSLTVGLGGGVETGVALREGGRPGDPRPSPLLFSGVLKVKVLEVEGWRPALAVDVGGDRLNWRPGVFTRLVASTGSFGPVRFAAFAGAEVWGFEPFKIGPVGGLAAAFALPRDFEVVAQGCGGLQGWDVGAALRWRPWTYVGVSLGLDYQPEISGWRAAAGLAFFSPSPPPRKKPAPVVEETPPEREKPAVVEERPRFALLIRGDRLPPVTPRHVHDAEPEGEPPAADEDAPSPKATKGVRELPVAGAGEPTKTGPADPGKQGRPGTSGPTALAVEPGKPGKPAAGKAGPQIAKVDLARPSFAIKSEPVLAEFPNARSTMKDSTRTALDELALGAAARSATVLVWAWVEPGTGRVAEAARRAVEVKRQLLSAGGMTDARVVAQVSTNAGVQGVQVVVSDLADRGKCPPKLDCKPPKARIELTSKGGFLLGHALTAVAVQFPTLKAGMRKADRQALSRVGLEGSTVEVHVWGRTASDLEGFENAAARAAEVAGLLLKEGVSESQIFFEVTVEPGTNGAEVLVTSHFPGKGRKP